MEDKRIDISAGFTPQKEVFEFINHSLPSGFLVAAPYPNMKILFANNTLIKMLGYGDLQDFIQSLQGDALHFVHPEDLERILAEASQRNRKWDSYEITYRMQRKTGDYLWVTQCSQHILNEKNEEIICACYTDISQQKRLEQELRNAHNTFESIVRSVPSGIGLYKFHGDRFEPLFFSDAACRMCQMTQTEYLAAVKDSIFSIIHPDDRAGLVAHIQQVLPQGKNIEYTYRLLQKNGGSRWITLTGSLMYMEEGCPVYNAVFTDVDALKKAELEHNEKIVLIQQQYDNELAFREASLNDCAVTFRINLTKDQVLDCSTTHKDFDILKQCHSVSELFSSIKHSFRDNKEAEEAYKVLNRTTLLERYAVGERIFNTEYRRILPDHRTCWLHVSIKLVTHPQSGDVIGFIYTKDVSTIKEVQSLIHQVVDLDYDYIAKIDLPNNIYKIYSRVDADLSLLPACGLFTTECKNYAYAFVVEEEIEQNIYDLSIENIREQLKNKNVFSCYASINAPDGSIRKKLLQLSYLDREFEQVMMTRVDVTDLYVKEREQNQILKAALEAANSASSAKSDFLSRISHDMRTPMNGILGLAGLMREKNSIAEIYADIDQILLSGSYLLDLINDTLDVNRIESGHLELHPSVCDGKTLFSNILNLLRPNLAKKNVTFQIHVDNLPFTTIYVDAGRLAQVVVNVVGNAIKFTPENGRIDFYMENISCKDGVLIDRITVKDTGIGMSAEFLPHLFEPFSQEHGGNTSQYQGTGLGLTITKQIIELMGGEISVTSEPGKGTEFSFTMNFPIATEEHITAHKQQKNTYTDLSRLEGCHILLCEDHPLNAQIATKLLEKQKIIVHWAKDGETGVKMFTQSEMGFYHCILMDIRMPIMDGYEATRKIRALNRWDTQVPIIAMTANAFEQDIQKSLDAGMNAHLTKPIDPTLLYQTIVRFLK